MDNPHFNEDELKEIFENIHKAKKLGILTDDTKVIENFEIEKPVKIKENNLDTTSILFFSTSFPILLLSEEVPGSNRSHIFSIHNRSNAQEARGDFNKTFRASSYSGTKSAGKSFGGSGIVKISG